MRYNLICDWCGKPIKKYRINKHNFCSRQCLADFSNKSKNPNGYSQLKDFTNICAALTELNKRLNPTRMTSETRSKLRKAKLNKGNNTTYTKYYGKHEHRVVAERILGRTLRDGEIVHHRDGDKRNNNPENLVVFSSQSEHAKFHAEFRWFLQEIEKIGGDAE